MRKGDVGSNVLELQRKLLDAGFKVTADGWFGESTEAALIAFQRRAKLVADGFAGPKTLAALTQRVKNPKHLSEADLEMAASRLGCDVAAIKAVNEVESRGSGFLEDGRPVILYERHQAFRLLGESGVHYDTALVQSSKYPNLLNPKRGGYAGGSAEWARLASAKQIMPADVAHGACSWGQYQIMGYHWRLLGYPSCEAFVLSMHTGESAQLDAFVRFIEADTGLLKALQTAKWATFARLYNGPAYKDNLYDIKLARAFERLGALA